MWWEKERKDEEEDGRWETRRGVLLSEQSESRWLQLESR